MIPELCSVIYIVHGFCPDPLLQEGVVRFIGDIWHPRLIHEDWDYWIPMSRPSGPYFHVMYSGNQRDLLGIIRVTSYGSIEKLGVAKEVSNKIEKFVDGHWKLL